MTNPYRSPEAALTDDDGAAEPLRPGAHATLVARSLLYRRLVVEAPVEITLEFHGRSLRDKVIVNRQIVACRTSWWRITPRLPFELSRGNQRIGGLVEVRVWPWLALRGFRVTIANRVVYTEGNLKHR